MSDILREDKIWLQVLFPKQTVAVELLALFHAEDLPDVFLGQDLTEYLGSFSQIFYKTAWLLP
jgi:hypothetical protein